MDGAASLAATSVLQAGRYPDEALKILEAGRGVIGGYVISGLKKTSYLAMRYPHVSEKYEELRILASRPLQRIFYDSLEGRAALT